MAGARVDPLGSGDPATLGRYEIIGRLASGGMGRIYLARSSEGQLAAVKTLLAEGVVSDVDRRRFTREVELAQRVDSAFTARVREADPGAERPWMAIDYIAAPSLSELVRTAGVLPASAVRWLAAGTAEALVTLHREGIIHRDVKPQNILLPLPGPRVIDFGISHANDLTRTSLTLGTIAFTSPEQARGEPSTEASDVYSLGATLFHLALGRPPYRADSDTLGLLARVQRGELDLDGLPKELATLIRPCLAADPRQRPVPAEMLARFRQSLAGLPVSQGGSRWLPPRWTALITAYERQGQEFARGSRPGTADPDAPAADAPTGMVPPPRPTVMYTRERERARREQAAPAEQAEREKARAAQAERERLREEERHRLRQREQEREREETRKREREAAEKSARRRAGKQAADQAAARRRQDARSPSAAAGAPPGAPRASASSTPAGSSARTPAQSPARSPAAPKKSSSSTAVVLLILAVIALFIWQNTQSDDTSGSGSGGSTGSSAGTSGDTVTGVGSSRGAPLSGPTPGPTPDAEDAAFRGVSAGDCLTAYDDGYGSWSTDVPQSVDCDAADAYLLVTSEEDGLSASACPTGPGRSFWYHSGSRAEFGTRLCVSRRFRVGECFVAKRGGTGMRDGRLMTVWSCSEDTVPAGYDTILRITGRWRAESSYPPGYCAESRNDRAYYYTFEVDDEKTVLCTKPE